MTETFAWEKEQWCWEVPEIITRLHGGQMRTRRVFTRFGFTGFTPSRKGFCIIRPPNQHWSRRFVTPSKAEIIRDGVVYFVIDTAACLPTITQVKRLR